MTIQLIAQLLDLLIEILSDADLLAQLQEWWDTCRVSAAFLHARVGRRRHG